jgi:hypothetical protein
VRSKIVGKATRLWGALEGIHYAGGAKVTVDASTKRILTIGIPKDAASPAQVQEILKGVEQVKQCMGIQCVIFTF